MRFLALGDSYTMGEGVEDSQRWPAQLVARLREQSVAIEGADIVALTGWTTDELQQAIEAREFMPPYALVSLMIGVNNQYRGRNLDDYAEEFSCLFDFAVEMAGSDPRKLMVISIPDWGVTPFAAKQAIDTAQVGAEIDRFNATARAVSDARGAHWIDVTGLSRDQACNSLTQDGLHPSADQYACWVEAIFPTAHSILLPLAQGRW